MNADTRQFVKGELGSFTLGYLGTAAVGIVPQAVARFHAENPQVHIGLLEMPNSPAVIDLLQRRKIDLAILRPPVSVPEVAIISLLTDPLVALLPRSHPLAARRRVPLSALLKEPLVGLERDSAPEIFDSTFNGGGGARLPLQINVASVGIQSVLGLVGSGLGVSLLPESACIVQHPGVVVRPLQPPVPTLELVAAWRENDLPPAPERFLTILNRVAPSPGDSASA